jgi:AcrR family transcriptional regulator
MQNQTDTPTKLSKGKLTAQRIMDAAEDLFSRQGYEGTTLRQIAQQAQLQEPGLYNHFAGKLALYEAVLHRALNPMAEALSAHLSQASGLRDYTDLPSIMTDLLLDHPQIAALFQQAMQGDLDSVGNKLVRSWLDELFQKGILSLGGLGASAEDDPDQASLAINVIAMFNLTTGYFLSQRAFDTMAEGNLQAPENIARQKRLLHRVMRAMLIS